jgi:hypothetical protein
MAIIYPNNYPGQSAPISADYPQGALINVSAPAAGDGTPFEQAWANDIQGFLQSLLANATPPITASGAVDTVQISQYYQGLLNIVGQRNPATGVISGLTIENPVLNPTTDLQFNPGSAATQTAPNVATLTSALTKQITAAWVAGNNVGGLFSGAVAIDTTYHCFVIYDPITGNVDAGFSANVNASDRPVAYTEYARIASIRTDPLSIDLPLFTQLGDEFFLATPIQIRTGSLPIVGADTNEFIDCKAPGDIAAIANVRGVVRSVGGNVRGYFAPDFAVPAATTVISDYDLAVDDTASISVNIPLDTAATTNITNIYFSNSPTGTMLLALHGWTDRRGK